VRHDHRHGTHRGDRRNPAASLRRARGDHGVDIRLGRNNLINLDQVVAKGRFKFIGFPPKVRRSTASPIRRLAGNDVSHQTCS
jgi:hypothetical protein